MDYERGLTEFKVQLQASQSNSLVDFLILEARLRENLDIEQKFGTDETIRANRAQIIGALNRLALDTIGIAFNNLCLKSSSRFTHIPLPPQPYLAHHYPLQANFTGRLAERHMLTNWLMNDNRPILALLAIGGMGKSSLSWYWLQNDVNFAALDGVLWWSFYEGEASFAKFLDEALIYISGQMVDPTSQPSNYDKTRTLINLLQQRRVLLVLDGFERQLQAYANLSVVYQRDQVADETTDARACIDPNTTQLLRDLVAGLTQAKVLITTRLMVHDLEDRVGDPLAGCRKEELKSLHREDAVTFMQAQGVTKGTRAEITAVCEAYGHHPLSLRLLSGLIARDKRDPGDISTAPHHDVHGDLVARRHHVLEAAYDALPDNLQVLLSRLAAFRSSMTYEILMIFNDFSNEAQFDRGLDELIDRGLLFFDHERKWYDLHPIVQIYAYQRLKDKRNTHLQLIQHFQRVVTTGATKINTLDDLSPIIELYHHTVRAGEYDQAQNLFYRQLYEPILYQLGAYNVFIELLRALFPHGETELPQLSDKAYQSWTLGYLGYAHSILGQLHRALSFLQKAANISETIGDESNLSVRLNLLAHQVLVPLGLLREGEETLVQSINLAVGIGDGYKEALARRAISRLYIYCGRFEEAEYCLDASFQLFKQHGYPRDVVTNFAYRAQLALAKDEVQQAWQAAKEAYKLALEDQSERQVARAAWLLGIINLGVNRLEDAKQFVDTALEYCRRINLTELEPDILLAWARWHYANGDVKQSQEYIDEALSIADRCEYRLKQADIHNFLAQWVLEAGNIIEARKHAEIAKERAWCDGPPYCYKPALDTAERLLQAIGQGS